MNLSLLELLQCPHDGHSPLTLVESGQSAERGSEITQGVIQCQRCLRTYPVREGILSMLPDPLRDEHSEDAARAPEALAHPWQD